jgi:hypothetical protein
MKKVEEYYIGICGNDDPWTFIMVSILLRSYEKIRLRVTKKGMEKAF